MAWSVSDIPSQNARLVVVTGTGGLGYETALALTRSGAEVILAGRNPVKGAESIARIRARVPKAKARFEALDLGSLNSIKAFAQRLRQQAQRLDVLVNNAGVMMPPTRQLTADRFELQFGTNYLGHFALTGHLLPLLRKATTPRVVNVTSRAYHGGAIKFGDLQGEVSYNAYKAYAQSKLAQLMFALELQRRSDQQGWGLVSIAAHPGWAKTELFQNGPGPKSFVNRIHTLIAEPLFAQSAADGALPVLYAATAAEASGGLLYGPGGFMEMSGPPRRAKLLPMAARIEAAQNLWQVSESLTGTPFHKAAAGEIGVGVA